MFDAHTHYTDFWALGRLPSQLIIDVLMEDNGCDNFRVIHHNETINLSANSTRLNIWLDENGQIRSVYRG